MTKFANSHNKVHLFGRFVLLGVLEALSCQVVYLVAERSGAADLQPAVTGLGHGLCKVRNKDYHSLGLLKYMIDLAYFPTRLVGQRVPLYTNYI